MNYRNLGERIYEKKLYQNIKKVIGEKIFVLSFQSSELSIEFGTAIARTFGAIAQWGRNILKLHLNDIQP